MNETTKAPDTFAQAVELYFNKKEFTRLKRELCEINPADLALLFEEIDEKLIPFVYRILPKDLAAEVFVEMDTDLQELLLKSFSDFEIETIFGQMFLDDTVDIIEEMPAGVVKRILLNANAQRRKSINELLKYPPDSAGSIMTTEYVDLKRTMNVSDAFAHIKKTGINKETIYTCYVIDSNRHLLGLVTAKALLLAEQDDLIDDIMEKNVISVGTLDDREEVAQTFEKYDFLALPVVDGENRLIGIVTVDDAIDVIKEETEEDFAKMAAVMPGEKSYMKTGVLELWKARIPWLLILMVSATFTGMIINSFEDALASQVALAAFIPMLMGSGGNSGSQSSVAVIRSISLGQIKFSDIFKVQWKEIRVSILCALCLSAATFIKILVFDSWIMQNEAVTVWVAAVVAIAMAVTVVIAKFIGASLPILADRLGFDPAVMSNPFITTIVDAVSLIVYFAVAKAIIM